MTSELFPQEVRAAGRLRVVGGELVVELAGGAVLSRAACVAVHTPRRIWEHGDDPSVGSWRSAYLGSF